MSIETNGTNAALPELGFWVDGEFFEKISPEDGHREIAMRIIEERHFWKIAFEQSKMDPVDWLILRKGGIKIGNRFGLQIISYSINHLTKESSWIIEQYQSIGWKSDDISRYGYNW